MAVYFIRSPQGVKVGYSDDVLARLRQLQTANAARLEVIAVIPGASRDIEQEFHRLFSAFRLEGEWFKACGPVLRTVELIHQGAAPLLREHLQQIAQYAGSSREQRMVTRPPAIVPRELRGTETEMIIRNLDCLVRDPNLPRPILGKANAALRWALRGKKVDLAFLGEYSTTHLTSSRAVPNTA